MILDASALASPIAVTGSTGFIGARLCGVLGSAGVNVRALPRAADDALRGANTLIHLAGRAHVLRERDVDADAAFRAANVELTRKLLGAAAAAGITRVLFLSSIGAVATTSASDVTDATPPAPDAPYGRSKLAAEAIVRETCERTGLGYVVLRPPMVFGPGMKGNPLRLFRAIAAGMPLPVGMAKNRRSMMYVDNLIAAIMSALALPALTRDTFVVGDSAPVSSAELAREIGAALGRPARLLPVPRWMMQSAGSVGDMIDRVVPFPLTSTAVDRLFGSLAVDHSRFARVAGYAPPVDRREAMQRSADWLRQVR